MKKILFLILSMEGGGAEKVLLDILKNIDYTKYKIDLLLLSKSGVFLDDVPSNVNIIYLYSNTFIPKMMSLLKMSFLEKYILTKKIRENYDTIISFYEGIPLRYHRYISDFAIKNISWVHMDLFNNHYTKKYFSSKSEKQAYAKMDKLIFVSTDAKIQFEKLFKVNNDKIVIYNPIDKDSINDNQFMNDSIVKNKFTICSIGRLHPQKGYSKLLNVAKMFKDKGYNLDFWILGEGRLESQLLKLRKELNLEDCVHMLGFKKNPYPYLSFSDLFLSTSIAEGFSLVTAEAICLGIPVVCTNNTGPRELLNNGKYGILTNHDEKSIFEALKKLIDNSELLEKYKLLSMERAQFFNLNNTMEEIYKVI